MSNRKSPLLNLADPLVNSGYQSRRIIKDHLARIMVSLAGWSVILAIAVIFWFLLSSVLPLFKSAAVHFQAPVAVSHAVVNDEIVGMGMEERGRLAVRFIKQGQLVFFSPTDGSVVAQKQLPLANVEVTAFSHDPLSGWAVWGLSDGRILVLQVAYRSTYTNDVAGVEPEVIYPYG